MCFQNFPLAKYSLKMVLMLAAVVFTANFTILQFIMGKKLEEQIGDQELGNKCSTSQRLYQPSENSLIMYR